MAEKKDDGAYGDPVQIADQNWKDNTHTALSSVEEDKDDLTPDIDKVD